MNSYTVYHLHTDLSNCNGFADSCTNFKDYIKLAKSQGMKAIAFSEHGNIYEWVRKKQECDKAGIKYIHGVETYVCNNLEDDDRGCHIGLYARNFDGVLELNQLVSISTSKGKKEDKSDRHSYYNPRISLSELMNTSKNIIVTSACLASPLSRWSANEDMITTRDYLISWMKDNKDRCFLEIQYHNYENQKTYNQLLYEISMSTGVPLIAGTDTHSSSAYKAECRKLLQKSKDSFYGEEDEFDLSWKTYDELIEAFRFQNSLPEYAFVQAVENTNMLSNMVENFELDKSLKYPSLYGDNVNKLFTEKVATKYKQKSELRIIDEKNKRYLTNIKDELEAFRNQGMESFMLFMSELVDYCNENNIPYGFCRGSVGGSTIAYILDIIDVDPVVWNTVFSRFCNADRVSLADIDIDFAPKDRVKVYEYIINRFGSQYTAYIAQFGTLKDRGTIDVLAKGLDYQDLNLVKNIKEQHEEIYQKYVEIIQSEVNIEELDADYKTIDFDNHEIYTNIIRDKLAIKKANKFKGLFENLKSDNKDLFYYFDGLKGTIISKGHHPAGMIGSPITIQDNLGVFFSDGDDNFPVATCAMKAVDSLNYVKFDILGLKTVGIIKDTYRYIDSHYLKSYEIDWEDENVWSDMVTSKIGVFQFQGDYAFELLKSFQPHKINDMSLVNAALRPSGKSYRDRLIAREFNKNPSDEIDSLLAENNGYLVYQEDTIKFLTDICGFNGSLADTTRRAIGKKDIELLNEQLPKILDGYCKVSSKPRSVAEEEAREFIQIISDSSEYQFGYNHSTGYSMNGYACARLRAYHPLEFITAYLNNADDMNDIKMGTQLASERDIEIKPIEFGKSSAEYTFNREENKIYKGISSIKYCNIGIADDLLKLSQQNEYDNAVDLLYDVSHKTSVDARQMKILIILGLFYKYGKNKKLLQISNMIEKLADRKQINKSELEKYGIDESIFMRFVGSETPKLYKDLDMIGYIKEVSNRIEDKVLSVKEQIKFEMEYLEYPIYTNEKSPVDFYIVTEYKTYKDKTKPYVTLHNTKTGESKKTKVKSGKTFSQNPFGLFSGLMVREFSQQFKTKCVNGVWQKTNELEDILEDWEVY